MLDRYAAHLRYRGRSAATIDRRLCTLRQLAAHLEPLSASTDDLEAFLGRWEQPATRRAYRNDLRDFYRWAVAKGHATNDPATALDSIAEPDHEPRPLPASVIGALLEHPDPVTRRMIRIAAYAGLRVSEIANLEGMDVDPTAGTLRVGSSKGGHGRIVTLVPELAAELDGVGPGRLFPGASPESVSHRIKRALCRAGVPHAVPHDLRHTYATTVARRLRGDVVALASLLGHRNVATTQRYVKFWRPDADELTGLYDVA